MKFMPNFVAYDDATGSVEPVILSCFSKRKWAKKIVYIPSARGVTSGDPILPLGSRLRGTLRNQLFGTNIDNIAIEKHCAIKYMFDLQYYIDICSFENQVTVICEFLSLF